MFNQKVLLCKQENNLRGYFLFDFDEFIECIFRVQLIDIDIHDFSNDSVCYRGEKIKLK